MELRRLESLEESTLLFVPHHTSICTALDFCLSPRHILFVSGIRSPHPECAVYKRLVTPRLNVALSDTPVVLLIGPRRSGKTTLVQTVRDRERRYLTLDDPAVSSFASADPVGFVRGLDYAVIDEVQRAPELLLAIKKAVDEDYRPGRFLLTGSANVMTLPKVADSLAGRMETLRLFPLSRVEIEGRTPRFLDQVFAGDISPPDAVVLGDDLVELVVAGGFPEALQRSSSGRRRAWALAYLESVLGRDLRDIAEVERLTELPHFVRLLAEHSAQLVNFTQFGSGIGVSYKTAQRYVGLLQQTFLVSVLRPWHTNAIKRLVKSPKLHFVDTGIASAARGLGVDEIRKDRKKLGALLENYVYAELLRLLTAVEDPPQCFHFRDAKKNEVDLVLQRRDESVVGIEVKASATVSSADFNGLRKLAKAAGRRFTFGAVMYDGEEVLPFGESFAAVPVSSLWN